jgi:hypothetical protein
MDNLDYVNYVQSTVENESGGDMECIGTTVYVGEEWVNCRNNTSYPQTASASHPRHRYFRDERRRYVTSRKSRCSRRVLHIRT